MTGKDISICSIESKKPVYHLLQASSCQRYNSSLFLYLETYCSLKIKILVRLAVAIIDSMCMRFISRKGYTKYRDGMCVLFCDHEENGMHLFFQCSAVVSSSFTQA